MREIACEQARATSDGDRYIGGWGIYGDITFPDSDSDSDLVPAAAWLSYCCSFWWLYNIRIDIGNEVN